MLDTGKVIQRLKYRGRMEREVSESKSVRPEKKQVYVLTRGRSPGNVTDKDEGPCEKEVYRES